MNLKTKFLLILILLVFSFSAPKTASAVDYKTILSSASNTITNIQEGIEYFFAFKVENKVQVLEKHADKRLTLAQSYANKKDDQKLQNVMQSYLQIKEKQNDLLKKTNDEKVLNSVEKRTRGINSQMGKTHQ